jgi:hypothetical protein
MAEAIYSRDSSQIPHLKIADSSRKIIAGTGKSSANRAFSVIEHSLQ